MHLYFTSEIPVGESFTSSKSSCNVNAPGVKTALKSNKNL